MHEIYPGHKSVIGTPHQSGNHSVILAQKISSTRIYDLSDSLNLFQSFQSFKLIPSEAFMADTNSFFYGLEVGAPSTVSMKTLRLGHGHLMLISFYSMLLCLSPVEKDLHPRSVGPGPQDIQ